MAEASLSQKYCINHPDIPARARELCASCYGKWARQFGPQRTFCKNHPDRFNHARGLCDSCYNIWITSITEERLKKRKASHKAWWKANWERNRVYREKYYKKHGDKIRQRAKDRRKESDPDILWARQIKWKYGIGLKEYNSLLEKQGGACAICFTVYSEKLVVDHQHSSLKIRGLLCKRCNHLVGYIEKSPILVVRAAIEYASKEPSTEATVRPRRTSSGKIKSRK